MSPFEIQLAVKRAKESMKPVQGPGILWVLIVIMLIGIALAVSVFENSKPTDATISNSTLPTPTQQSRIYTVNYKSGVFNPTNLRIHAGDTVRFRNDSIFPIRIVAEGYPENSELPGFASVGDIPQGSFFAYTFSIKGIFDYYNEKTPSEKGTIIVR